MSWTSAIRPVPLRRFKPLCLVAFCAIAAGCGGQARRLPAPDDADPSSGEASQDETLAYEPYEEPPARQGRRTVERGRYESLLEAVRHGSLEDARYHLERGASPAVRAAEERGLLHLAADLREPELVRLLAGRGAPINVQDAAGATPLHYAAQNLDAQMVGLLLREGADPNLRDSQGRTPLDYAIAFADARSIRLLRAAGGEEGAGLGFGVPPESFPFGTG